MATVAVAADNARWDSMDATTNVTSIGGGAGAGAEPDIVYQGSNSVSRKVTSAGFYTSTGANRDMTAAGRTTWIVKTWLTNYNSLSTTGNVHEVRVGSGTSAYYTYTIGSPTVDYPAKGGWVIDAIDPSIASHRDSTTGSPSLTTCSYFAAFATCSTSKGENLCLDAIDAGVGLYLTGGDGVDTDGVFDDFVTDDEGDVTNGRFGYVTTISGTLFVLGRLIIGASSSTGTRTATATGFTDSGVALTFPENRAAAGFSGITIDLGNASTDVNLTRCSFTSAGTAAGEDTRAVWEVFGASGALDMVSCNLTDFASVDLTSACTVTDCVFSGCGPVDAGSGADLAGSTITNSSVSADASALIWDVNLDPNGELDNMNFVKGSSAHHAIELGTTSPLSVTLTGHRYSGFNASNGQNDSTIYVARTTGTVTINVSGGGDTPSYKTAGATVVINNAVTVKVTAKDADDSSNIQGARLLLEADTGGDLPSQATVTITRSGSTATVSHTAHGMSNGQKVAIRKADQSEYNGIKTISNVTTNAYDYTVSGTPTTPATGTITATAVILDGTTDSGGVVQDTGFNYTNPQPVVGKVRKGTASPRY